MTTTEATPNSLAGPKPPGAAKLGRVTPTHLRQALRRGWADFKAAPGYGLFVALVYVIGGWAISAVAIATGQSYWLVFAAIGFPLIAPFTAIALYEVSRRLSEHTPLKAREIFGVVWQQRLGQLPSICALIVVAFLFWFFLAHMIFALFLGLSPMTNVSSSLEIYFSANGLMMLGFGTVVGAVFATILFMLTVFSLPMLLDRDVDFMTAMLTSFMSVQANPFVLLGWGGALAALLFVAMIPGFFGLFLFLPWLGHASWHLYALARK